MHEVKDGKITLSTGVVFKIKDVPVMVLGAIKSRMAASRPKVPVIFIEDKDREEPNPNDPDYIAAVEDWEAELTEEIIDAIIVLGVGLDSVPEGMDKPDGDIWAGQLAKVRVEVSGSKGSDERLLSWIKLYAASSEEDINSLIMACSKGAGVSEEDVAESATMFRNRAERRANRAASSKA
jgi:hypothetical protein|tara:strand:+ start:17867 stop:18406 length:540 start_codon:yes stop_codon:yes gene_type:complete